MNFLIEARDAVISRIPQIQQRHQAAEQQLRAAAERNRWNDKQQRVDGFLQQTGAEELLMEVLTEDGFSPEIIRPNFNESHETRFILDRSLYKTSKLLVLRNEVQLGMHSPDRLVVRGGRPYILGPKLWEDKGKMWKFMRIVATDPLHWFEFAHTPRTS